MPEKDILPSTPIPYLPTDPTRVTGVEVEKMIESRLHSFWHQQRAEASGNKKKNIYTNAAIGLGGFLVGVGGMLLIGRLRRGSVNATMAARPPLTAVK